MISKVELLTVRLVSMRARQSVDTRQRPADDRRIGQTLAKLRARAASDTRCAMVHLSVS